MEHAQCMILLLLQVQDMNLLHTLVAGCLSYKEWLERRDMLVSIVITFVAQLWLLHQSVIRIK